MTARGASSTGRSPATLVAAPARRIDTERRRLVLVLLLSLMLHAWLLSLTFGGEALGLPGFALPWQERRGQALEVRVVLTPAPSTAADPVVAGLADIPPVAPMQALASWAPDAPVAQQDQSGTVQARPVAEPSIAPAQPTRLPVPAPAAAPTAAPPPTAAPTPAPAAATPPEPTPMAPPPAPGPAAESGPMPAPPTPPIPVITSAPRAASPDFAPPQAQDRAEADRARAEQSAIAERSERAERAERADRADRAAQAARARVAEAARLESVRQDAQRLSEQQEAARKDAERQEAQRQAAARQEVLRLESSRQEAARAEAARVETSRAEAVRAEAARLDAERQEAARLAAARQDAARQEAGRADSARLADAQAAVARREASLRAIGRQLAEEADRRDAAAAAAAAAARLSPSSSALRRGRLFGLTDANAEVILYAEAFGRKIQLNQAFEQVRDAARQPHTQPVVTVAIRSDGSVEAVTFVRSSGVLAIDEAVRRIVQSLSPYPAFSPALARDYDVLEIRRTWYFDMAIRLY